MPYRLILMGKSCWYLIKEHVCSHYDKLCRFCVAVPFNLFTGLSRPGKLYSIKKEKESVQEEVRKAVQKWQVEKSPRKAKLPGLFAKMTVSLERENNKGRMIRHPGYLGFRSLRQIACVKDEATVQKHIKTIKNRDKPTYPFKVVKPGSRGIVQQLKRKAKKLQEHTGVKGQHTGVKIQQKPFVLPVKSSRSSRIIIPNKRFLEDESVNDLHMIKKPPILEKDVREVQVKGQLSIESLDSGLFSSVGTEKLPKLPLADISPGIPKTPILSGKYIKVVSMVIG